MALEEAVSYMNNTITENISSELSQNSNEGVNQLRKIATKFINQYQKHKETIQRLEKASSKAQQLRHQINAGKQHPPEDPNLAKQYAKAKEAAKIDNDTKSSLNDFLVAAMFFNQNILQQIQGHNVRIAVVIPRAKKPPFIMDFSFQEAMKENSGVKIVPEFKDGKLVGRFRFNMRQMEKSLTRADQEDSLIDANSLILLNQAYLKSLEIYKKFKPYVFWYLSTEANKKNRWKALRIGGSAGDFAQAYANFFYIKNKKNSEVFPPNQELYNKNLEHFLLFGVQMVDNVSGLLTSDIVTDLYDYAVKSSRASMPGYTQMVKLANEILDSKNFTLEDLQEMSKKAQFSNYDKNVQLEDLQRSGLRNTLIESVNIKNLISSNEKITYTAADVQSFFK